MPAPLAVPWNKERIITQTVVFVIVVGALAFLCHQLGGWNAGAVAAMAVCLVLFFAYAGKLLLVLGRAHALELGPQGLMVNTGRAPRALAWSDIAALVAVPAKGRRFDNLVLTLASGEELTVNGMYLGLPAREIVQAAEAWKGETARD